MRLYPAPTRFADLGDTNDERWAHTPLGSFHMTKTELRLVQLVEASDGKPVPKARIALELGRDPKSVSRCLANLRREGVLESSATFRQDGGQGPNSYRIASGAHPGKR